MFSLVPPYILDQPHTPPHLLPQASTTPAAAPSACTASNLKSTLEHLMGKRHGIAPQAVSLEAEVDNYLAIPPPQLVMKISFSSGRYVRVVSDVRY